MNDKPIKPFIFSLTLCLMPLLSHSQSILVHGKVVDINHKPLVGVNIFLLSNWRIGTSSDTKGRFVLSFKKKYQTDSLVISYIGYRETIVPIDTSSIEVTLTSIVKEINEVVISSEKLIAEEFSIKKIEQLDIYLNPSAKADPILAVNSLPSATTTDESANISFRGSSPTLTGIYLNNVPIYDAVRFSQLNGIGTFSLFNTSVIDNVQVFAGNPPIEYGNTASGLIALSSTQRLPHTTTKSIAISPASFGGTIVTPLGKRQVSSISVFANYQPSAIIKAMNKASLKDILSFRSLDAGVHYLRKLGNGQLKIFNYTLNERYRYDYRHPSFRGDFYQSKKRNFTIASWRKVISESHEISINGSLSKSQANYRYSSANFTLSNTDTYASANHLLYINTFSLKYGVSYDHRHLVGNFTRHYYDFALSKNHPTSQYHSDKHIHLLEGYLYAKHQVNDQFIIGVGFRKNVPIESVKSYWSIQANGKVKLSEQHLININIGQYHKVDFARSARHITLYQCRQASIDYTYQQSKMSYQVATYYIHFPLQSATTKGIELFIEGNPTSAIKLQSSITYLEKTKKYPRFFAKGMLTYKLPKLWSVSTTFSMREGNYYDKIGHVVFRKILRAYQPFIVSTDSERHDHYATIDMSISRLIPTGENTTIIAFASINNILNRKNPRTIEYNRDYSEHTVSPFSLRTFYAGIVVNW